MWTCGGSVEERFKFEEVLFMYLYTVCTCHHQSKRDGRCIVIWIVSVLIISVLAEPA